MVAFCSSPRRLGESVFQFDAGLEAFNELRFFPHERSDIRTTVAPAVILNVSGEILHGMTRRNNRFGCL